MESGRRDSRRSTFFGRRRRNSFTHDCDGGNGTNELALLHGGAQNAHPPTTRWPSRATDHSSGPSDLPGHRTLIPHRSRRRHRESRLGRARALEQLITPRRPLVGIVLADSRPCWWRTNGPTRRVAHARDITPGVNADKARQITDFGERARRSFDDSTRSWHERSNTTPPARSRQLSPRHLANAVQQSDGSWCGVTSSTRDLNSAPRRRRSLGEVVRTRDARHAPTRHGPGVRG